MKSALVLVDLQGDYLASRGMEPAAGPLIARAAALLEGCRQRRVPIIHVWTTIHRDDDRRLPHWKQNGRWLCVAGTAGHQPPTPLRPLDGETVIHKAGFNAFAGGELDAALRRLNCEAALLAGVHLHACVRTTAAECLERGLQVFVAEDAVGSNDPLHAMATRRWLAERCVRFDSVSAILTRLDGGETTVLVHRSPRATDQILFEVPIPGAREVATATAAADSAWQSWRRTSPAIRQQLFATVADRLETAAPELARQMATEIGKPLSHGLEEVGRAAATVRDVVRRAAAFERHTREAAGVVRHQPLGAVVLISPWNNPVAIPVGKIIPALLYGNTVVWKPAPATTEIAKGVLRLLHEAGVPPHVVQLLPGDHTTAQQLAASQSIRAVTFTGSVHAGHAMQEICARCMVPLQAELGGNNAAIVWDAADVPGAAAQIAQAAFGFAGQRCTANRRVIVRAPGFEDFLRGLKAAAENLVWGEPLEKHTDIGPVINAAKHAEHNVVITQAQASRAAHRVDWLHAAPASEAWAKQGACAQPAIACCDQPDSPLVQEETMSPLLVVQRAEDFEHALALCNGVRHGLVAALFSSSPELQRRFLAEAQAGILKLNLATAGADASLPFGGWKASGIGPPEHGEGDRLFYTRMQAVYGAAGLDLT